MQNQQSSSSTSWLSCCLQGCLVVSLLGIVLGYYAYVKTMEGARNLAASGLEFFAEEAFKGTNFSASETQKLMKPIQDLAGKIRKAEIGVMQAQKVGNALLESPVFWVMGAASFENVHVKNSKLSPDEKQQAHIVISRFMRGAMDKKIDRKKIDEVSAIASEQVEDKQGKTRKQYKKSLTMAELKQCLEIMEKEANAAKIIEGTEIDLAKEIETAIQKGLAKE